MPTNGSSREPPGMGGSFSHKPPWKESSHFLRHSWPPMTTTRPCATTARQRARPQSQPGIGQVFGSGASSLQTPFSGSCLSGVKEKTSRVFAWLSSNPPTIRADFPRVRSNPPITKSFPLYTTCAAANRAFGTGGALNQDLVERSNTDTARSSSSPPQPPTT